MDLPKLLEIGKELNLQGQDLSLSSSFPFVRGEVLSDSFYKPKGRS